MNRLSIKGLLEHIIRPRINPFIANPHQTGVRQNSDGHKERASFCDIVYANEYTYAMEHVSHTLSGLLLGTKVARRPTVRDSAGGARWLPGAAFR